MSWVMSYGVVDLLSKLPAAVYSANINTVLNGIIGFFQVYITYPFLRNEDIYQQIDT